MLLLHRNNVQYLDLHKPANLISLCLKARRKTLLTHWRHVQAPITISSN